MVPVHKKLGPLYSFWEVIHVVCVAHGCCNWAGKQREQAMAPGNLGSSVQRQEVTLRNDLVRGVAGQASAAATTSVSYSYALCTNLQSHVRRRATVIPQRNNVCWGSF